VKGYQGCRLTAQASIDDLALRELIDGDDLPGELSDWRIVKFSRRFRVARPGASVRAITTAPLFRWIAGRAMRRARPSLTRIGCRRVSGSRLMRLRHQPLSWFRAMCRRSSGVS